ncbi:MAG: cytochrome c oxidase assembly protein [Candidatus Dormibacteraeota bacterium]|nr:cytochrome c oxidase assembly protein [Candidatus Dormibacteraeota bacterium]
MTWAALAQWSPEPVPVLAAAAACFLYAAGRRSEGAPGQRVRWASRDSWFASGLAVTLLALVSPIAAYDTQLQWDHMLQHVLLLIVAPPMLLLGDCFGTVRRGVINLRGAQAEKLLQPFDASARWLHRSGAAAPLVLLLFSADLLVWHIPALYDATLSNDLLHDLEHTLFFASGLLFWDQAIALSPGRRLSLAGRASLVLGAMIVSWVLAVIIGYASHPLYTYPIPVHGALSALGDQQIAAGIMWVPGSAPFIIALVCFGISWFESEERMATELTPQAQLK